MENLTIVEMFYDEEKTKIKERYYADQNGWIQGLYELFYLDGKHSLKCTYINDLRHGLYEEFYSDGKLRKKYMYIMGVKQ